MRLHVALWSALLCASVAQAKPSVDIQLFQPSPSPLGFFTLEPGEVPIHLGLTFGGNLNYGHNLLEVQVINTNGTQQSVGTVVQNRVDLDLMFSIGLFNMFEIGVVMPVVYENGFQAANFAAAGVNLGNTTLPTFTPGDLRVIPKYQIVNVANNTFSLAFLATFTLPTAGQAPYTGDSFLTFAPGFALTTRPTNFLRFGLDLGYRIRKQVTIDTFSIGNEYYWRAGGAWDLSFGGSVPIELVGEVFGNTSSAHPYNMGLTGNRAQFNLAASPTEADIGLRIVAGNYILTAGGGGGIMPGYGAPAPRIFLSTAWYSGNTVQPDEDGDGIPDAWDKCPDKPEDKDGFQDADGCPDVDNDKDGVVDDDDQCPNDPEDKDGFQDADGCPDPDNDNDGILDKLDKCPNEPEDKDGFQDADGCPDLDNDKDGIADAVDKCPNEPEDMDGFEDADGCPDLDNDKDGLPDLNDQCPNYPEDKDGFQDADGCPEDNDGDGIADDRDKCPNQAENYNGIQDADGCPDALDKKTLVKVTEDKIEIKEAVFFKTGAAKIEPRSFEMLNQVAAVLKNYRNITLVRIEGHTDNQGPRAKNTHLSQERAGAVRQYLIGKGVEGKRLEAKGFGPDKPIQSNKTPKGREANRRVEFVIAEQHPVGEAVKPTATPKAPPPPPPVTTPAPAVPGEEATPGATPAEPGVAPTATPPADAPLLDLGGKEAGSAGKAAPATKKKGKKKKEQIQFGF